VKREYSHSPSPEKTMKRKLSQGLALSLMLWGQAGAQGGIPFFDPFDNTDAWTVVATIPGFDLIENDGTNNYLKLHSSGESGLIHLLRREFASVKPNVLSFRIMRETPTSPPPGPGPASNEKIVISFVHALGPFSFVSDGVTLKDGGELSFGGGITQLAADTWYDIRLEIGYPGSSQNIVKMIVTESGQTTPFFTTESRNTDISDIDQIEISYSNTSPGNLFVRVDDFLLRNEFTLTTIAENGTIQVTPPPIASGKYIDGTVVSLTPQADAGFAFTRWEGDASNDENPLSLIMNSDKEVEAVFTPVDADHILTVLNLNGVPGSTDFTISEGDAISVTTAVPAGKAFVSWQIRKGPGSVIIGSPNATTTTVSLSGGNATIEPVFENPAVEVSVRDASFDDNTRMQPVIQIRNASANFPLTQFQLRFLWHADCFRVPQRTGPASQGGWTLSDPLALDDAGNFELRFTYTLTLLPGETVATPAGVFLAYDPACTDCPGSVHKIPNAYSLRIPGGGVAKGQFVALNRDNHVLVMRSPDDDPGESIFGVLPEFIIEKRPGQPPGIGTFTPIPVVLPESRDRQIPNLTLSQSFPLGNFVSNGSFEQEMAGWREFSINGPEPEFNIATHGPTPQEAALDGFHYAAITTSTGGINGLSFEIHESDPAFAVIENSSVTFGAWVRGSGENNFPINLALFHGEEDFEESPSLELSAAWQLLQFTVVARNPMGAPGDRKFRFAILATSGPYFVDGVTLTREDRYIPPQQTTTWFNTRNSVMQTRSLLQGEISPFGFNADQTRVVIANNEYDNLGRLNRKFLPFTEPCPSDNCNPFFDPVEFISQLDEANDHYTAGNPEGLPDAGGFAYSKPIYEEDQITTIRKIGRPGRSYQAENPALTPDGQDHTVRTHYSGVNSLNPADLGGDLSKPANQQNPLYAYTHTVDPNQNEALEWKNGFGQVEKHASVLVENGQKRFIATEYVYDARGNMIRLLPPLSCRLRDGITATNIPNCVEPTEYAYDSRNRLIEEKNPDAGLTTYFYDLSGQRRITQNQAQRESGRAMVSVYDAHGRVKYTGEYQSPDGIGNSPAVLRAFAEDPDWPPESSELFTLFSKFFYDEMPPAVPPDLAEYNAAFGKEVRLYPDVFANTFANTRGRLCAVIDFQPPIPSLDNSALAQVEEFTTKAFNYDKFGRIVESFVYNGFITNPENKLQLAAHSYDVSEKIVQTRRYNNASIPSPSRIENFTYDANGRLQEIRDLAGSSIASYAYMPSTGQVKTVELNGDGDNPIMVTYAYNINGGVEDIQAVRQTDGGEVTLYSQELYYDLLPDQTTATPQFNGNLAQSNTFLGSPSSIRRNSEYAYDNLNRLVEAVSFFQPDAQRSRDDKYSESIRYFENGRIRSLRRGGNVQQTSGGEYHYFENTNRLAHLTPGMEPGERNRSGSLANPAFEYDSAGRLVSDRSKEMQIRYDFRDRPLEFSFIESGNRKKAVMRYDHAGKRVSKLSLAKEGLIPFDQVLVDGDPARVRDHSGLVDALSDLKARIGSLTQHPGEVTIHVVPDADGYVDMNGLNEITAIPFRGGMAELELIGLRPGEPEYQALITEREGNYVLESGQHYASFGNETREVNSGNGALETRVLTDLPNGLGRYNPGSLEILYNLKNQLGSTMVTALSGGMAGEDNYDYFPYGKQDRVAVSPQEKVTHTFTGKELDDQLGLYYFGTRYLDPELALWISPDPCRQHHSPYTYGGNDPANRVDPDGCLDFFQFFSNLLAGGEQIMGPASDEEPKEKEFKAIVDTDEPNYAIAPNEAARAAADQLANVLERDLVITSGYRPGARGAHGKLGGNAFDLGHNANRLKIPRETMEKAYKAVFDTNNSMAIEETGAYHFQLQPGRGGATGFLPGLRDANGELVNR
jgi:RHS repeat-associated protein